MQSCEVPRWDATISFKVLGKKRKKSENAQIAAKSQLDIPLA